MHSVLRRYRQSFEGLPRQAWILAFVMLVNRSGAMVMTFLSIYLSHELGWGERFAGNAIAVYGVGAVVGAYLGGYSSAKFGSYRVQQASLLGTAIGFITLSVMTTKSTVLLNLFLVSIAAETLRPANVNAIAETVPPELHRRAFALNRLALNLGFTFGPAIGGLLAQVSYTLLFYVDAASCVAATLLLTGFHHTEKKRVPHVVEPNEFPVNSNAPSTLATTGQFTCFVGATFVMFLIFFQLLSTHPIFLRNEYSMAEWQIGMLFSINTLIIVAFEMVLVDSLQRFRDLRVIAVGALLACEGFAILSLGDGYPTAIAALVVWTTGEMIAMPTMLAYISRSSPVDVRAKRIGVYSMTGAMAFVVAPLLGALCYSLHPRLIWWIAAATGPIVFFAFRSIDASAALHSPESMATCNRIEPSICQKRERSIRETGLERVEPFL